MMMPASWVCGLALVALHHVDATNDSAIFLRQDLEDFAGTALVLAGEYDDLVALTIFCIARRSLTVLREPAR